MSASSTNRRRRPREATSVFPGEIQQNRNINENRNITSESSISAADQRPATPASGWTSKVNIEKIPVMFRLALPVFLVALADKMTHVIIGDVMRKILCILWYSRNRPDEVPKDGPIPFEKCFTPGPAAWFSAYNVISDIMIALCSFLVASLVAQYSAVVGRKPILILILFGFTVALISFTSMLFIFNDIMALTSLGIWMITASLCNKHSTILIANLIAVDSSTHKTRTTNLSMVFGVEVAGSIPAFLGGRIIQEYAGAPFLCLLVISIGLLALFYAVTPLVPETFGKDQREAVRLERRERHRQARERSLERWNAHAHAHAHAEDMNGLNPNSLSIGQNAVQRVLRAARKTVDGVRTVFDPVLRLKPTKKENGKMNARLTILASSYFFWALGTGYFGPAVIPYMKVMVMMVLMDYEQTDLVFRCYMVFQLIGYTVVLPALVKCGQILYNNIHEKSQRKGEYKTVHNSRREEEQRSLLSDQDEQSHTQDIRYVDGVVVNDVEVEDPETPDTLNNPHSELVSAHFDIYLLRSCFIVASIFFIAFGFARSSVELILVCAFVMFFIGTHPSILSIGVASVEPIVAGEVIAGLEMIGGIGKTLSPLIFGYVQLNAIFKMPMLIFLSMSVCTFLGVLLSFFIRDEDRYIPPFHQPGFPLSPLSPASPSSPLSPLAPAQRSLHATSSSPLSSISEVGHRTGN